MPVRLNLKSIICGSPSVVQSGCSTILYPTAYQQSVWLAKLMGRAGCLPMRAGLMAKRKTGEWRSLSGRARFQGINLFVILLEKRIHAADDLWQHIHAVAIQMQAQAWQMIKAVIVRFRPAEHLINPAITEYITELRIQTH